MPIRLLTDIKERRNRFSDGKKVMRKEENESFSLYPIIFLRVSEIELLHK